jgi:hypothetical protein
MKKEYDILSINNNDNKRYCIDYDLQLSLNLPLEFSRCDTCYKKAYSLFVGIYDP